MKRALDKTIASCEHGLAAFATPQDVVKFLAENKSLTRAFEDALYAEEGWEWSPHQVRERHFVCVDGVDPNVGVMDKLKLLGYKSKSFFLTTRFCMSVRRRSDPSLPAETRVADADQDAAATSDKGKITAWFSSMKYDRILVGRTRSCACKHCMVGQEPPAGTVCPCAARGLTGDWARAAVAAPKLPKPHEWLKAKKGRK